jgi:hypothetical protein
MSETKAFCPRCRRETPFVEAGGFRECAVCGVRYKQTGSTPSDSPSISSEVMSVLGVLFRVFLIMAAIVVVGVGVLFAGCALMLGGGHF